MHVDVETGDGTVRGSRQGRVAVFRGIPFGSLEDAFAEPGPVRGRSGVRDCTAFGPPPPQSGLDVDTTGPPGDWLSLNVWSPDLHGRFPVMVWVHGGAYAFGWSGLPEHDGAALARRGVVVVTLTYRVGLAGFGHVDGAPANRGLLDQVAALRWVRDNVAAFGGDPELVTVFGQSAGGGSVAALLAMPRARGLFRRAVAQSVQGTFFTPVLAADVTRTCAAELGVAPEDLSALDPWLLPLATDEVASRLRTYAVRWGAPALAGVLLAPVVDGEVLPTTPWCGLSGDVDLLVSHTRDEQRLLTALAGDLGEITAERATRTARLLAPDPSPYLSTFPDPEELYEVVLSDWLFRMPSLHLARAQVEAGGTAYLADLTWSAPGMGGTLGACHGLDVPLVLGNLTAGAPAALIGDVTAEAEELSEQMGSAWVAFATTGDPGWPTFDDGSTMLFDVASRVVDYPERVSREVWRSAPGVLDLPPRADLSARPPSPATPDPGPATPDPPPARA